MQHDYGAQDGRGPAVALYLECLQWCSQWQIGPGSGECHVGHTGTCSNMLLKCARCLVSARRRMHWWVCAATWIKTAARPLLLTSANLSRQQKQHDVLWLCTHCTAHLKAIPMFSCRPHRHGTIQESQQQLHRKEQQRQHWSATATILPAACPPQCCSLPLQPTTDGICIRAV